MRQSPAPITVTIFILVLGGIAIGLPLYLNSISPPPPPRAEQLVTWSTTFVVNVSGYGACTFVEAGGDTVLVGCQPEVSA